MFRSISCRPADRRGAIAVLAALLIVTFLGIMAFGIDVGYLALARTELQNAADASAMAGAAGLIDAPSQALAQAKIFGEHNYAAAHDVIIVPAEDVAIGMWNFQNRTFQAATTATLSQANAVQTTTRLDSSRTNSAPLFFARIFGRDSQDMDAVATAALWSNLKGFRIPPNGQNLPLLPIAYDLDTWEEAMAGIGPDNWSWDGGQGQTNATPDGVKEINLHPEGNNGSPGNRGLIEIGPDGGDTNAFRQQILHGINPAELNHHGGSLELSSQGQMTLSGETGIRSTLQGDLHAIVGQTRIVPLFNQLADSGTNASYTIVKFGAVRIMEVDFNGSPKRIIAQPTHVYIHGAIPDTSGASGSSSDMIYSAPRLVW
ncbi:MAG: pilus assembly protein TadG-related protein [Planctomycetota bacterium]|nr:pilus assembly protein TadG-related protein [Planctomycetota bacterium]